MNYVVGSEEVLEDGFSSGVDEARQRAKATNARKPRRWRIEVRFRQKKRQGFAAGQYLTKSSALYENKLRERLDGGVVDGWLM